MFKTFLKLYITLIILSCSFLIKHNSLKNINSHIYLDIKKAIYENDKRTIIEKLKALEKFDNKTKNKKKINKLFNKACKALYQDGVVLLINLADINYQKKDGNTALNSLCCNYKDKNYEKRLEIVKMLLDAGANPNIAGQFNRTPLISASTYGCKKLVNLLIEYNSEINSISMGKETALTEACRTGKISIVISLLNAGADINAKIETNCTALDIVKSCKEFTHRYEKFPLFNEYDNLAIVLESRGARSGINDGCVVS